MILVLNPLMTGLMVFKIVETYWQVKPLYSQIFGVTRGGSKLRPIIFMIIESGMKLFAI